uniref:Uncharacterized protein n=1 Tax=Arundo donax TaxID=35708 RepID=A0A0A9FI03_ARUDO
MFYPQMESKIQM